MHGRHIKGDNPISVRLGEDLEFWVRTYATENGMTIGQVIRYAVEEYTEVHPDRCSVKLD
jgi:hypothetical protein